MAIALAIVLLHTQTASAFKETATSNEDGFQQGVKDANRDLQGLNGHGFDDSCPKDQEAIADMTDCRSIFERNHQRH